MDIYYDQPFSLTGAMETSLLGFYHNEVALMGKVESLVIPVGGSELLLLARAVEGGIKVLKFLGDRPSLLELLCFFVSTCGLAFRWLELLELFRSGNLEQVISACSGDRFASWSLHHCQCLWEELMRWVA